MADNVAGTLSAAAVVSGSLNTASTASGSLNGEAQLAGTLNAEAGVSGSLSGGAQLEGSVSNPVIVDLPYTLPVATTTVLGGVKASSDSGKVSVDADGLMTPNLARVANTGSYDDLSGTPADDTGITYAEINAIF